MVLNALVVVLHPGRLLLVRLDIVDEVLLSAASRIIIVGNPVVPLVHAKFDRGVNQLALKLRLLGRKDHLFAILIWLELGDLARVVGRALGELHADAGGHEHFLVCLANHQHLFVRQLAFIIKVVAKTASYRVSTRIGLVALSKCLLKAIRCSSCTHHGFLRAPTPLCRSRFSRRVSCGTWVLREWNIDAVDLLMVLFSLF